MPKESKVLGYSGIALYPTEAQKFQLNKIFGCVRYVYNSMINAREWEYQKGITHFLDKEETPVPGKNTEELCMNGEKFSPRSQNSNTHG